MLRNDFIHYFSAGVGRSGTFIALDHLTQCIECGRNIDVFGTVYEMRVERCHMVQNEVERLFITRESDQFAPVPVGQNFLKILINSHEMLFTWK